jgi:hypothetical protein
MVMRHASITLTMDTYGHMFPGHQAKTVARLAEMLGGTPATLRATGTNDAAGEGSKSAQRLAQRAGRDLTCKRRRPWECTPTGARCQLPILPRVMP